MAGFFRQNFGILLFYTLFGMFLGLGAFTFVYAKGASYMTDNPEACANCHVMNPQLASWTKSSHRHAATCNDCHTPHRLVGKYVTKAINGFNHSLRFTLGDFPEPIRITERNRKITEQACRDCHRTITDAIDPDPAHKGAQLSCIKCHDSVGHDTAGHQ